MSNDKPETPKFDKLLDFIEKSASNGSISKEILFEFQVGLHSTISELGTITQQLAKKSIEKVGWLAFGIGLIIGLAAGIITSSFLN